MFACPSQVDFSEQKQQLVDKETKKRMLEELWADRVVIPPEEAQEAENDMHSKKQALTVVKSDNQQKRTKLREQASAFASGVAELREREKALAAQAQKAAEANAEADEMRAKMQSHLSAAQRSREQMAESSNALESAKAQCEQLTQRLAALHKQVDEENAQTKELALKGDGESLKLSRLREQAEEEAKASGEIHTINTIVSTLAGVKKVVSTAADGTTLRYELSPIGAAFGPGSHEEPPSLVLGFDAQSGALASVRVEPTSVADPGFLAALEAHAVRTNSVEVVVRELQAYLELSPSQRAETAEAVTAAMQPSADAAIAAAASLATALAPFGSAHRVGFAPPLDGSAQRVPPPASASQRPAPTPAVQPSGSAFASHRQPPPQPPAATPAGMLPVENLDSRMAGAGTPAAARAAAATPKPTPSGWSSSAAQPAPMEAEETPSVVFRPTKALPRTPAAGAAMGAGPSSAGGASILPSPRKTDYKADTVPRSQYQPPPPAAPADQQVYPLSLPGVRIEFIEADAAGAIGARRDGASGGKRPPRKSFLRSVAHPRSPCSRAAGAGIGMNPRSAIHDLLGAGGPNEKAKPLQRIFTTTDAAGQLRTSLMDDGSVVDSAGVLLAYIEENGTVGDPDMDYVGEVTAPNDNVVGYVTNKDDQLVAEIDYGRGIIRDPNGSTIASITRNGEVSGHCGARCGTLDGFNFGMLRRAAAYLTLVDSAFLDGK